jgi:hypothetical protein
VISTWSNSSFYHEPEIFDEKNRCSSSNKYRYTKRESKTTQINVSNIAESLSYPRNNVNELKKVLSVLNGIENSCLELNTDIVKKKDIIGIHKLIAEIKQRYYSQLHSHLKKD